MESLVCIFVLSLLVIIVANLYPGSLLSVRTSEQRLKAGELAQNLLAEAMARDFSGLAPGDAPVQNMDYAGMKFETQLKVLQDPQVDPRLLLGIRVEVSWTHRGNRRTLTRECWRARVVR